MDFIDIKQVAEELKISKVAVYKKLKNKQFKDYIIKKDNKTCVTMEGLEVLRASLKVNFDKIENDINIEDKPEEINKLNLNTELIIQLKKENEFLKSQLENKDVQLKEETQYLKSELSETRKQVENMQILLKQSQEIALLNTPKNDEEVQATETQKRSLKDKIKDFFS